MSQTLFCMFVVLSVAVKNIFPISIGNRTARTHSSSFPVSVVCDGGFQLWMLIIFADVCISPQFGSSETLTAPFQTRTFIISLL